MFNGDFSDTIEKAYACLNKTDIVAPGSNLSVQVAKGQTLIVRVWNDERIFFIMKKNGEVIRDVNVDTGGHTLLFSNK